MPPQDLCGEVENGGAWGGRRIAKGTSGGKTKKK